MATEGVSINPSTWSPPVTGGKQTKLIACVRPINWPIQRLKRRQAWRAHERISAGVVTSGDHVDNEEIPLVLVQTTANRQVVVMICPRARAQGVRAGLSLAQARALCPGLAYAQHDAARDAKALEALARWLIRFTPTVQVAEGGIFLDVTGTQRLYGSLENLLQRLAEALSRVRVPARLAIAPTVGAACALTHSEHPQRPLLTAPLTEPVPPLPRLPPPP